jgi:AraC family transcriptional regulator, regulatory protein of adaptative response / methylated-DNA-[protein]-cysteine methyltransferase
MQNVKENVEEQYWRAVVEKDSRANGTFFVAVRSTGVYCKPSCPSRRPKRENVTFFTSPEAAEQAGYRACKRCRPRETAQADPQVEIAQRICRYIEQHL